MRTFLLITTNRSDRAQIHAIKDALEDGKAERVSVLNVSSDSDVISFFDVPCVVNDELQNNWSYGSPDCAVILGDRHEALSSAVTLTWWRIPIAHIHGGEATFGAMDNQIRDALTKLSHIHFVANETYGGRIINSLGEEISRVIVSGSPGIDIVSKFTDVPRGPHRIILISWNPVSIGRENTSLLLDALSHTDLSTFKKIFTVSRGDPGDWSIRSDIEEFCTEREDASIVEFADGGYLRTMRQSVIVIGNSSSGIIEAPILECPSVDIGSRQDGRLRGPSVFHANNTRQSILAAIRDAMAYQGPFDSPYGAPGASKIIADALLSSDPPSLVKRFTYA